MSDISMRGQAELIDQVVREPTKYHSSAITRTLLDQGLFISPS